MAELSDVVDESNKRSAEPTRGEVVNIETGVDTAIGALDHIEGLVMG